ncbi:cation diffusion facilitator family transporter [Salinicoccus roseus]|uniref:Cation diffusion facilitator family transporter n=1 Tax=Salinicoccus roseus TaxID=45670 RepID=A0A0C2DLR9_9STAP|nr:cation diffusion facilitator family transporter [Salinicoccus roseus]KIH70958.1 cation transporter [Salinicoccus roseus]MBY8908232.1 cation diffusion facilitator family transporter [Salinicoccus roseus]MDB0580183.1 cation diffusion facilitator family transporter [Salinicoccus roseus]RPE54361.1 cation diffusion facilitator family transporter [Salinicoccus roseus]GGA66101.1 cation transporter [Salinicoccus roseus]
MSNRYRKAQIATMIGIAVNLLLAVLKAVGGILGNSRALVADAAHSASDVVSSIAVLVGIRAAQKPPDSEHPYGHGKSENVATLIVAILLVVVGFEIIYNAIVSLMTGTAENYTTMIALYVIIFSIVVKEVLFQYKYRLGTRIKSPALIADAWHHRSDAISSVVALIGIGLSIIGTAYGIPYLGYLDPIASAIIALIIMYMGFQLAKEAVSMTLEVVLNEDETEEMRETVVNIDKVRQIDRLIARSHGSYVIIDIKISVDADITVEEGHRVARVVKQTLLKNHEEVMDVNVHVNPY